MATADAAPQVAQKPWLVCHCSSAFAVADYAGYRWPEMKIVFVTRQNFFSDGSIFRHAANACTMLSRDTRPSDLDAVLDHYAAP